MPACPSIEWLLLDDAVILQLLEASGEYVFRNTKVSLEIGEPFCAQKHFAQDQDRPAVSKDVHGLLDRAVLTHPDRNRVVFVFFRSHWGAQFRLFICAD